MALPFSPAFARPQEGIFFFFFLLAFAHSLFDRAVPPFPLREAAPMTGIECTPSFGFTQMGGDFFPPPSRTRRTSSKHLFYVPLFSLHPRRDRSFLFPPDIVQRRPPLFPGGQKKKTAFFLFSPARCGRSASFFSQPKKILPFF